MKGMLSTDDVYDGGAVGLCGQSNNQATKIIFARFLYVLGRL